MSGSFDVAAATAYISMSAGSATAVTTGAYTIATLVLPAAGNNNAGMAAAYVSGTVSRELFEDTNALFGEGDFSSGFGTLTQGTWYLCAQTKTAGSATYRHHIWAYASDGSGTMSHGVASGAGNHGDGGSIATELRIGSNDVKGNGLIAVVGYWSRALSDAELDSMKSGSLTAWRDVSGGAPAELISLQNWNGSTGCTSVIGTATQSSITGTVSTGANPPSFDFTLSTAAVPISPQRAVPIRDYGEVQWLQRDRRDANTVASAANPLPAPLDVAFGAGGPLWWQRGGAVDAAPRTWQPQQRTSGDPSLLTPAAGPTGVPQRTVQTRDYGETQWLQQPRRDPTVLGAALLENELLGGAETITRVTSPVTNAPRWWMPEQPKRDAYTPGLLDSAQLEDALLGGGDTAKRYLEPATHAPRWWAPQQPARQGYTPGLLDAAELEGPLLAGDIRRHGHPASYTDRREVPQQRAYISDPSFYPTVPPTDPLTLAYGAGGTYWLLYNTAAVEVDRRESPQQRRYVSDPGLLGTALLEDALLGGATTVQRLTWWTDRREVPQQRPYISDPSAYPTTAATDPLSLAYGAGGTYWQMYNTVPTTVSRRLVPQQRPYVSDPALLATALLEDVLLGRADTVRHLTWYTDRRMMPQQRIYTDPAELASALLEGPLLGGADTARHAFFITDRRLVPQQPPRLTYAGTVPADPNDLAGDRWFRVLTAVTHADRRETVPQRIALVFVGVPAPAVVKATSDSTVTASRTSSASVASRRTSTAAVTARRTSTGGVT